MNKGRKKMAEKDTLGDILKAFEGTEAGRSAMPGLPIVARLDGRSFHTFTKGLERPFDNRLSSAMIETTRYLVDQTNADLGYTQSDEITLFWKNDKAIDNNMLFGGRFQKLVSILAAMGTSRFTFEIINRIPEKAKLAPLFDCRVFQLPNAELVADCFKWRELDATKNAISMAAHAHFSHKSLQGLNGSQKQERLFAEKGINFDDYPVFFKRGTYIRRVKRVAELDEEVRMKIPEKNRPAPGHKFERTVIEEVDWKKCTSMTNFVDVVYGAEPIYY